MHQATLDGTINPNGFSFKVVFAEKSIYESHKQYIGSTIFHAFLQRHTKSIKLYEFKDQL